MKKLMCLVLVLAVSSVASALSGNILEDFESYPVGDILTNHGWFAGNPGAGIRVGSDGTNMVFDNPTPSYYYQVWRGDTTNPEGLFTLDDPIEAGYAGPAHMAMTLSGYTYDTTYGLQRNDGYPGPIIGGGLAGVDTNWITLHLQAGMWGDEYHTAEQLPAWNVIDVGLNIDIAADGSSTGSLYYRDITAEGPSAPWHGTSLVNIDLNVPGWFPLYDRLYIRGAFYGEQDDLAYGKGHVPEPCTIVLLGLGGLLLRKRR